MKEKKTKAQAAPTPPTPKASVRKLERERSKLQAFREDLESGETLDDTSVRTSLLGRTD